jgi:hypothetical protein
MRHLSRSHRSAVVSALALGALVAPSLTTPALAAASAKPGLVGGRIMLQDQAEFAGWDVAYDASGTAYIGWISSAGTSNNSRQVHLCTVPAGASSCAGGIQTIASLEPSTAAGLQVLVTPSGTATLVWSHEVPVPVYQGRDARISEATSQSGGPLSAPVDVADAPSYSTLYDAVAGPGGAIWTVMAEGAGTSNFELREGVTNAPITVATPYAPGSVQIAFQGSKPVVAIQEDGRITEPAAAATASGAGIGAFTNVAKTWTAGANIGLVGTKSGVRLIASIDDASYVPVVSKWTGSGFSARKPIGDHNSCAPSSHDLGTDASGRVVDISNECGLLAVDNLANTTSAGIVRFSAGGTNAAGPAQIASTPRGHAIAVWAVESATNVANRLYFARVLLPGLDTSASKSGVIVRGPVSCQPGSTIAVSVKGSRAGWKVASASLTFGGKKLAAKATIDGSKLKGGKVYALTGRVVFTKGGASSVGTDTLKFRSCSNP